jgi:hypothetical protein
VHQDRKCQAKTLFGTITLRRRYYHHTRAGTGRRPLDERLDLVRGHMPGLARLVCRASAVSGSYEAAAGDLHAHLGLAIEGRGFGRLVADIVPELRAARDSRTAPVDKEPVVILYAASDGTGVPLRRRELAGIKARQPDGTARTREVKLGCIFTQTTTDKDGEPLRDEASTTCVGTFDDCRAAGTQLRAKALLGAGPEATALQSDWCHAIIADSSAPVLAAARNLLTARQSKLSPEQVETAQREITYFTTNATRTRYGEFRAKGSLIGSGVVEAVCRTLVGPRL